MHLLSGAAGTGKTYTLSEITQYAEQKRMRVIITGPTHKSVHVLKRTVQNNYHGVEAPFCTIHSALGMREYIETDGSISFKSDPKLGYPAEGFDLIIVDEASMLDDRIFEELVNLSEKGKKILFVGDPYQIPPVAHKYSQPFLPEAQEKYGIGVSVLNEIIRQVQGSPIVSYATIIRADIGKRFQIFDSQEVKSELGQLFIFKKANSRLLEVLPLFKTKEYQENIDYVKVIAWRNATVDNYNKMIREYIFGENLPKIMVGDRLVMDAPMQQDRKIMISTNEEVEVTSVYIETEVLSDDYSLKYYRARVRVFNKELFNEYILRIIHEDSEATFEKILEMQRNLAKSYVPGSWQAKSAWTDFYEFYNSYARVKYSYCITGHKSQSSTYHTAYVLAWDIMANWTVLERNKILYTSCTRPSHSLYVEA